MPPVYESLLLNTAVPQIQAAQAGDSYVMVVNATTPALRITQTGTGDSILVEDAANPDSSPFVVTAAGDVGIGTNAPSRFVDIEKNQNASTILRVGNTTSGTGAYSALQLSSSTNSYLYNFSAGYTTSGKFAAGSTLLDAGGSGGLGLNAESSSIILYTGSTERARITSDGYFKAQGNSTYISSTGTYHEFVATLAANAMFRAENKNNTSGNSVFATYLGSNCNDTSSYHYSAITSGSDKLYIYGNGNVVNVNNSYGSLSDAKLKENVTDATPKLDKLNQVRIVNFNIIGQEQKQIGVIAQELEQIFPGMVDASPDRDMEGNDLGTTTKSVKYSVFVPMLIKAMQEQQAIINDLRARVAALEAN